MPSPNEPSGPHMCSARWLPLRFDRDVQLGKTVNADKGDKYLALLGVAFKIKAVLDVPQEEVYQFVSIHPGPSAAKATVYHLARRRQRT